MEPDRQLTPTGVRLPVKPGPRVCVVQPNKSAYSETFIRNHLENLPTTVRMLYGGWFPAFRDDARRVLTAPHVALDKAARFLPSSLQTLNHYWKSQTLARFFRRNHIDLVLAEYGPTAALINDACNAARTPFVAHFHGFDAYDQSTLEKYGAAYRTMFDSASAVIAVSRDMECQLLRLGASREKLRYIPYGVDCSLFGEAQPEKASPTFLAVGRFVDKKAPHLIILAFNRVVAHFPDSRLIMVGDGDLYEACKQMTRALNLSERIEFKGPLPNTEVAKLMQSSRAFVQHSVTATYGDSEGTPVAILEAGAAGLPVVSTRHAGIKDVVIEGETGFLVDEGDVALMSDHMIRLAENAELAGSLGRQARKHIRAHFSLHESIEQLWNVLLEAVKNSRRSGNA